MTELLWISLAVPVLRGWRLNHSFVVNVLMKMLPVIMILRREYFENSPESKFLDKNVI